MEIAGRAGTSASIVYRAPGNPSCTPSPAAARCAPIALCGDSRSSSATRIPCAAKMPATQVGDRNADSHRSIPRAARLPTSTRPCLAQSGRSRGALGERPRLAEARDAGVDKPRVVGRHGCVSRCRGGASRRGEVLDHHIGRARSSASAVAMPSGCFRFRVIERLLRWVYW